MPLYAEEGAFLWLAWVFESNPGTRYTSARLSSPKSGSPGKAVSSQYWAGQMPYDFGSSTPSSYIYSICANYTIEDEPQVTLIGNPYMYTGRRYDIETGLYYYRARYYNPYIGRFLQLDPACDGMNDAYWGFKREAGWEYGWSEYHRNKDLKPITNSGYGHWIQEFPMSCVPATLVNMFGRINDLYAAAYYDAYGKKFIPPTEADIRSWFEIKTGKEAIYLWGSYFENGTVNVQGNGIYIKGHKDFGTIDYVCKLLNDKLDLIDSIDSTEKTIKGILPRYKVMTPIKGKKSYSYLVGSEDILIQYLKIGPIFFGQSINLGEGKWAKHASCITYYKNNEKYYDYYRDPSGILRDNNPGIWYWIDDPADWSMFHVPSNYQGRSLDGWLLAVYAYDNPIMVPISYKEYKGE